AEAQNVNAVASENLKPDNVGQAKTWALHSHAVTAIRVPLRRFGVNLENELPQIAMSWAKATSDFLVGHVTGVARNLVVFFVDFGIMLITLFYLLRDGEGYYEGVRAMTPLHEEDKAAVFETLRITLSSVM